MRRPWRNPEPPPGRVRKTLVGSGVLTTLAGLTALANRQRYVTGESKVTHLVPTADGVVVVLADSRMFWAPQQSTEALRTYVAADAPTLNYRIDQFRRTRNGLAVGQVNVQD